VSATPTPLQTAIAATATPDYTMYALIGGAALLLMTMGGGKRR
jgi:hypothetical protein